MSHRRHPVSLFFLVLVCALPWAVLALQSQHEAHASGPAAQQPAQQSAQTPDDQPAQEPAPQFTVLPTVGEPFPAAGVRSSAVGGWTFDTPDGPRTLSAGELVRFGSPVEPGDDPQWILPGGGLLVADIDGMTSDVVRGQIEQFGPLAIPSTQLQGLVIRPPADRAARDELFYRIQDAGADSDLLILANGDQTSGELRNLTADAALLAVGQSTTSVPRDRITAVIFRSPPQEAIPADSKTILVGFRDGSLVRAASLAIANDQARIELAGGVALAAAAEDVVYLQPLGGRVRYLSDLVADSYVHQPYLDLSWPYRANRNVAGGPLAAGGRRYAKGLGMHSGGRIAYRLSETDRWLAAEVAIDDATAGQGSVVFQVYLAKEGRWTVAWSSPVLRGGDDPLAVRVDLAGAEGIALSVDYADRGDQWDRADWLDARLIEAALGE